MGFWEKTVAKDDSNLPSPDFLVLGVVDLDFHEFSLLEVDA